MEQDRGRDRLQRTELAARRFLFALVVASLALVALVAWPLASALLVAAVFAVVLAPLEERLARALGGRRQLAAGVIVLAVLVLVIGPVIAMSAFVINEIADAVRFIVQTVRGEGLEGLLKELPAPLDRWVATARERLGDVGQFLETQLRSQGGAAASAVGAAIAATGQLVFQAAMMLIALFFLLVAGGAVNQWLDETLPLRRGQTRELFAEFKKVSNAIIVSTLITAALQTAVAVVGYLIAGLPYPWFFAGLTFFMALIPAVGAAVVCLFAAFLLLVTGHPYMAGFLAVWAVAVVGLVDNIAKPYFMKDDVQLHGAVVFFALIGGIAAFGMVGLLVGPLAVALGLAVLRIYRRDFLT